MALSAAKSDPALVIHVGDYRYRDSGVQLGDNWDNWKKDFFDPAKPLLAAAPWIALRGNHENCFKEKGKGNGWYYLLEPKFGEVTRCPKDPDREFDSQPPFAIDLGYDEGKLRLVAIDSADAKYRCADWAKAFLDGQDDVARSMLTAHPGRPTWLLTHYPVWDASEPFLRFDAGIDNEARCAVDHRPSPHTTFAYRRVMSELVQGLDGSSRLDAIVSGDTHHFQFLRAHADPAGGGMDLDGPRPLQVIAGNGGTKLDITLGPGKGELFAFSCDGRRDLEGALTTDPVAYYQRALAETDPPAIMAGRAFCLYGYAEALRTGAEAWEIALRPLSESGLDDASCALGPDLDQDATSRPMPPTAAS